MKSASLDFNGSIAKNYEDLLGPFLFEPFASDLVKRIDFSKAENILELACGSGRVTKLLADHICGPSPYIAGDLNADMVAIAKTKVLSTKVTWATVDMLDIPYWDNAFDLVVCQFGIMLVPDQLKALSEIFRVLKTGGKLLFTTWAGMADNKLLDIGNTVLGTFLKAHPISSNPGPFAMSDKVAVLELLKKTGFDGYKAFSVKNTGEIATAAMAAKGFILGLPVISFIKQQGPELLPDIIQSLEDNLVKFLGDNPMKVSQHAFVFEAVK